MKNRHRTERPGSTQNARRPRAKYETILYILSLVIVCNTYALYYIQCPAKYMYRKRCKMGYGANMGKQISTSDSCYPVVGAKQDILIAALNISA